jgi:hypothetical protein
MTVALQVTSLCILERDSNAKVGWAAEIFPNFCTLSHHTASAR